MPDKRLLNGLLQHPVAYGGDESGFFGQLDEHGWRHLAKFGIAPSRQSLGTHQSAIGDGDLGLIMDTELTPLHALAHGMVHLDARQHIDIHLRLVEAEAPPAPLFHPVHGGIGILNQFIQ